MHPRMAAFRFRMLDVVGDDILQYSDVLWIAIKSGQVSLYIIVELCFDNCELGTIRAIMWKFPILDQLDQQSVQ